MSDNPANNASRKILLDFIYIYMIALKMEMVADSFCRSCDKEILPMKLTQITKQVLILIIGIIMGIALLTAVYFIPQDLIWENTAISADILHDEDPRPYVLTGVNASKLDNHTDPLMLDILYYKTGSFTDDVLLASYVEVADYKPDEALFAYLWNEDHDYFTSYYSRYWHGYQVIIKPMLMLFTLSSIRLINFIAQTGLSFAIMGILIAKKRGELAIPFFAAWLCLMPFTVYLSLQYSSTFYVTMILALIIALLYEKLDAAKLCILFEIGGIAEAYFDFLTYPIVSLGIPLILFFSLDADTQYTIKARIIQFFSICFSWCLGYAGMWAGKWMIAELFTSESSLSIAFSKIQQRSSHVNGTIEFNLLSTLRENLFYYRNSVIILFIFAVLAAAVVLYIKCGVKKPSGSLVLPLVLCCIMPLAWYQLAMEHSYTHACFTYRGLAVAIYGIISLVYLCIHRCAVTCEVVGNG